MISNCVSATSCLGVFTVVILCGNVGAAQRNAERGKDAFVRQCALCHTIEKGDPNRYGPNLFGIVGRKAGTVPGFKYSSAFRAAANWNWDTTRISAWISAPATVIPGSEMAEFQGVAARDRDDIIAYLTEHDGHAP